VSTLIYPPNPLEVLIVDDDPIARSILQSFWQQCGYQPQVVEGGPQALSLAQARFFDIICMDCQMPDLDGWQTSSQIVQDWKTAQPMIFAVTSLEDAATQQKCLASGMKRFFNKPMQLNNVESMVSEANYPLDQLALLKNYGQARKLLKSIIAEFLRRGPELLAQMQIHRKHSEFSELAKVAHSIKGSASYFYAQPVQLFAQNVQSEPTSDRQILRLRAEILRLCKVLENLKL
jgi:CheY-like chemotaxis protein